MLNTLKDRVAVVTGGGRGLGATIALALSKHGATVIITGRTPEPLEATVNSINNHGGNAHAIVCDVTNPSQVRSLEQQVSQLSGHADILINNAGLAQSAPIAKTSFELWNQVMHTNATGTFLCMQAFATGMLNKRWGRIVNLASIAGLHGAKYVAAYSASKHAVIGLTRSAALEWGYAGLTCNAICPGYISGEMVRQAIETVMGRSNLSYEKAERAFLNTTGQSRLVTADEIAHLSISLCANEALAINGEAIELNPRDEIYDT